MFFQRVSLFAERALKTGASSTGIWAHTSPGILHFTNRRKRTNLLKQGTFTPSMEGEGRNFTIISTSDGQNSRVTFQKSANA